MVLNRLTAVGLGVAALSVAGLAGCGSSYSTGSSSSGATAATTTAAAAMTVAEYRTTANGICKAALAEVHSLAPPTATVASVKSYLEKTLVAGRGQVDGLTALTPPAEFAANHAVLVKSGADGVALIEGLVTDLGSGASVKDVVAKINGSTYKALAAKEDRAAIAMGVQECAND